MTPEKVQNRRVQGAVNHRFDERNMKDGVYHECSGEFQSDGTGVHYALGIGRT